MNSPCTLLSAALIAACTSLPGLRAQSNPERSAEIDRALKVVEDYLAAEQSSAGERVQSRSRLLEFKFRSTRENGRFRDLSEGAWREFELARSQEVQRLQLIGEPRVEDQSEDLVRVHCAVHLSATENGTNWEGVSLRSFEVHLDGEEARIRHERLLAHREGIKPGQWKKLRKIDNDSRTNLRSSPTTKSQNVVGKIENGEAMHVWDQEDERWLFVRTTKGQVGFVHRSQIDFETPPESTGDDEAVAEIRKQKAHPFGVGLPGKPGYVLNPYTNSIVDVRGLRAGTLVRDPRDPVKNRAFRVPFMTTPGRAVIVSE